MRRYDTHDMPEGPERADALCGPTAVAGNTHSKYQMHRCCPADWRQTRDITGSYELDGMIARAKNRDMHDRLEDHIVSDVAYQLRNDYNGYSGMD